MSKRKQPATSLRLVLIGVGALILTCCGGSGSLAPSHAPPFTRASVGAPSTIVTHYVHNPNLIIISIHKK